MVVSEGGDGDVGGGGCSQIVLSLWLIIFTETAELLEKRKRGGSAICRLLYLLQLHTQR